MNNNELVMVMEMKRPMNAFCYAYSRALVEKLKEMRETSRIWLSQDKTIACDGELTPMATAVLTALDEQISLFRYDIFNCSKRNFDVDDHIAACEEFLAIFKEKKTT